MLSESVRAAKAPPNCRNQSGRAARDRDIGPGIRAAARLDPRQQNGKLEWMDRAFVCVRPQLMERRSHHLLRLCDTDLYL